MFALSGLHCFHHTPVQICVLLWFVALRLVSSSFVVNMRVIVFASFLVALCSGLSSKCPSDTGGSCRWMDCHSSRNSICVNRHCVCREGECAFEGNCQCQNSGPCHNGKWICSCPAGFCLKPSTTICVRPTSAEDELRTEATLVTGTAFQGNTSDSGSVVAVGREHFR